jgi:Transglycosylase SLT domain
MKKLCLWAALACVLQSATVLAGPTDLFQGLGKDREHLTPELIALRSEQLEMGSDFYLLRFPQAKDAPARIFSPGIWNAIQRAARQSDIDPMVLAGMIFIESYGNPLAKSPTGPAGIAQMTKSSAREMGLSVNRRIVVGSRDVVKTRTVGRGKNKRTITETKHVLVYRTVDERFDPELAIMAMARRVSNRRAWLGGKLDFAVAEYHMGAGRMAKLLSAYFDRKVRPDDVPAVMNGSTLTYPELFWTNTPYYRPAVYKQLDELSRVDFSPTYYFRVQQASRLLALYRRSSSSYADLVETYRSRPGRVVSPNAMWTFASDADAQRLTFRRPEDVQAELGQRIVQLPTVAAQFGVRSVTSVDAPAAAERSTIGCLLFLARQLEQLEGKSYKGFETGALAQSVEGQAGSTDRKSLLAADGWPQMHTLGWAFEVPRKSLSKDALRDLNFILTDLRFAGLLAFVDADKPKGFQVVRHPSSAGLFEQFYWDAVAEPTTVQDLRPLQP